MSFWAGVVQGVKDIDVLKEKEGLAAERDRIRQYNEERDRKADERYESQLQRDEDRYATAQERLDAKDAQDSEDRAIDRGLKIIEMGGSAFGGALRGQGGDVNAGEVIPVAGMNAAVMGINAELEAAGGMANLNDSDKEWFKTVTSNPAAAAGILAFAQAQREDGNDLPITELPQIIQLAGTMEAAGEEAYNDFRERFVAGNVDMNDPEQFLAGMQALRQYKPAQVVWGQVQAVNTPATVKLDYEMWQTNTTTNARVAMANMEVGTPEQVALANTLVNAGSKGPDNALTREKAFVDLWEDYGRDTAEGLGLDSSNPWMKPYFGIVSNKSPEGAFTSPTAPVAPLVPETSGMASEGAPVESQATSNPATFSFDTEEEARAVIDRMTPEELAKIPYIIIGGVRGTNPSYVGSDEAPLSQESPEAQTSIGQLDLEQTRLAPEDLQTTVSTGDKRPVVEGIGDLAKPSALDKVTSAYVEAKGEPLVPEEELAIGIEAIIVGLSGDTMDQAELDSLIVELEQKFTQEKVREALLLAMNQ